MSGPRGSLVTVEGPIAAGKTTLARRLGEALGAEVVLEPVEENPFLQGFYDDPRALAFRTQLFFLVNRFHEQLRIEELVAAGTDVVVDYAFQKDRLFAQLNLDPEELALYDEVFSLIEPRAPRPDLLVLLGCDVDALLARVAARARSFERSLTRGYMERVVAAYERLHDELPGVPALEVDADRVDARRDDDLAGVVKLVQEHLHSPA